jgi:beta-lactamase regulating signal transducer with metallopeptidase domain
LPKEGLKPVTRIAQNPPAENYLPTSKTNLQSILVETNQDRSVPFKAVMMLVWLLGVVFMVARLVVGWFRLRRIYLSAEPVSESEYFEDIFDQKLKVLLTYQVDSPVCFGIFRPVVILPLEMYNNSSSEDLNMVLRHEYAHIKRGDCLTNLLQRIIEAVFFFHPLLWYASFQLTRQREQICDNHVLAHGASAAGYVELLSRTCQQGFEKKRLHAVALFEGRLLYRIRSLLDPKHDKQIRVSRWAVIISGVVAVTCLLICTLRLEAKSEIAKVYEDVFVYVTDNQGTAVADASIEALADYKPVGLAQTNADGRAVLNVPQDSVISWIIALKSGKGFDYYENYKQHHTRLEEIPEQITLVLDGARDIVIRGVDSEDNPVPDVPFVPWTIIKEGKNSHVNLSGSTIARVFTDEKGLASFDWFPSYTTEEIKDSVRTASSFMVQSGEYYWPDYQTRPYSEYSTDTIARLMHRTPISGKVILPDGGGKADILVRAEGRGNTPFFYRGQTRTGPDGSYLLNVYPDQVYMITVIDDFWASDTQSGIVVREGESVQDIDLHLLGGHLNRRPDYN